MNKKYEFTDETTKVDGHTLHRIRAVRCFSDVKAGDLGGWIEKENNLSHEGYAWVYGEGKVYGKAHVIGNARVCNHAQVYNNALVSRNAVVGDNAMVYNHAIVYGNALVLYNAKVYGYASVCDSALVGHQAKVYGFANISGGTRITGDAEVYCHADYITFKNFWSSGRFFTWTRSNNMWSVGCFYGTGEELINKAYKDSEKSGREYERVVRYVESILADEKKGGEG